MFLAVFQATGSILSGLGGGQPFNYGALIPYGFLFSIEIFYLLLILMDF